MLSEEGEATVLEQHAAGTGTTISICCVQMGDCDFPYMIPQHR